MFRRMLHTGAPLRAVRKPQFNVKAMLARLPDYVGSVQAREPVDGEQLISRLQELPERQKEVAQIDGEVRVVQSRRKVLEAEMAAGMHRAAGAELKMLKQKYQALATRGKALREEIRATCEDLPNLLDQSTPHSEPEIVEWLNPLPEYRADARCEHHDVMVRKKLVDFQAAAEVTGSSWYYLINEGAMLEHALVSYATRKARQWGFSLCMPPSIARSEVIAACGFRPRDQNDEQQIYAIEGSNLGLTATAEIPLAGLGLNRTLDLASPRALCGVSRSYRAEAGARGRDTKGLYRVHEFTKVELFYWAKPADSAALLEKLRAFQTELISELGLSAKVLNMPANDLGAPAFKKYDIEVWMRGRGSFGEVSSASNCTDFQSRRLSTRFVNDAGDLDYPHTLNGTAMAVPRVIVAIVENFYDPETDRIRIPDPLQPYMDGMQYI
ncbi:FAFR412Cp [Eremothecium gossypii FDAG1]|nr:FAFR412Cp [Eremothecium gossypii FDAG1]